MTDKQLEEKVSDLEKRIVALESQRTTVNVYPGYQIQPVPMPQPQFPPITSPWCGNVTGAWPNTNPMPLTTC